MSQWFLCVFLIVCFSFSCFSVFLSVLSNNVLLFKISTLSFCLSAAVIVGGVVGALFAAFLVMLLVYRMKKKDEGSYTLEEPKQATVTYQKPDKQEEFYA